MRRPADCESVSMDPPSPMPVMPASVSMVTTMSLWLKSGLGSGVCQARMRVIFIVGRAAKTGRELVAAAAMVAVRD